MAGARTVSGLTRPLALLTWLRVLSAAGVVRPYPPLVLYRTARAVLAWGIGPAGGSATLAARFPDRVGLVDELGELTFSELHRRSNALAAGLRARGVGPGVVVAVLCRNHRGFVDASLAAAKLGADLLYLNTDFAGPQLADVLDREGSTVLIHDDEFHALLGSAEGVDRIVAWTDEGAAGRDTLAVLIDAGSPAELRPPDRPGRVIILTSGTSGTPKGAPRSTAGIDAAVSLLSRLPLRQGRRTHVAAPLFHAWGWAHWALAMLLGSTLVLRRRFDPEECLRTVVEDRCESLVVVPVMLQRVLTLSNEVLDGYDLSGLEVVAASGSALPGDLATRWMDRFGDTLFNVYGSTEVAYATVAGPADLRSAPGTAGRPPWATVVRVLDDAGEQVPRGRSGRIFVGNTLLLEGYTGAGREAPRERVGGLMATGDLGRFDEEGRLFVEGRVDEMIVSGGENVYPQQVEDCLARHPDVVEAAAVGVDDDRFGRRLRAFVVRRPGSALDEATLREHVRGRLARFQVPREIVFVEELPRNATGKVLKRELVEHG